MVDPLDPPAVPPYVPRHHVPAYRWVRQCDAHPEGPVRWMGNEDCFLCDGPGRPTGMPNTLLEPTDFVPDE